MEVVDVGRPVRGVDRARPSISVISLPPDEPPVRVVRAVWPLVLDPTGALTGNFVAIGDQRVRIAPAVAEAVERMTASVWFEDTAAELTLESLAEGVQHRTDVAALRVGSEWNTTGVAAHWTLAAATTHALHEVVERHQALAALAGETSMVALDLERHLPGDWSALLERFRLRCELVDISPVGDSGADWAPRVVMALVVDLTTAGPALTAGLGAGEDVHAAASKAVREALQIRTWLYASAASSMGGAARPGSGSDAAEIRSGLERAHWYADPAHAAALLDHVESSKRDRPSGRPLPRLEEFSRAELTAACLDSPFHVALVTCRSAHRFYTSEQNQTVSLPIPHPFA